MSILLLLLSLVFDIFGWCAWAAHSTDAIVWWASLALALPIAFSSYPGATATLGLWALHLWTNYLSVVCAAQIVCSWIVWTVPAMVMGSLMLVCVITKRLPYPSALVVALAVYMYMIEYQAMIPDIDVSIEPVAPTTISSSIATINHQYALVDRWIENHTQIK
jgi:hypothetical protein